MGSKLKKSKSKANAGGRRKGKKAIGSKKKNSKNNANAGGHKDIKLCTYPPTKSVRVDPMPTAKQPKRIKQPPICWPTFMQFVVGTPPMEVIRMKAKPKDSSRDVYKHYYLLEEEEEEWREKEKKKSWRVIMRTIKAMREREIWSDPGQPQSEQEKIQKLRIKPINDESSTDTEDENDCYGAEEEETFVPEQKLDEPQDLFLIVVVAASSMHSIVAVILELSWIPFVGGIVLLL